MVCTTLSNIVKDCANNTGGLRNAYIFDMEDITSIAEDNTTWKVTTLDITTDLGVTSVPPTEFEFKRNIASYTEDESAELTSGNNTNTVTLNLVFTRRDALKSRSLKILGEGQRYLGIMVKDANGKYWLIKDAQLSATAEGSGTARADGSKYAVTFIAEADYLIKEIDEADALEFITKGYFSAL